MNNSNNTAEKTIATLIDESSIDDTLRERGERYGTFQEHARVTQAMKAAACSATGYALNPSQAEAIDMILHKVGRIVCGDPDYIDSWHDIIGYAKLVEDQLNGKIQ